MPETRGAASKPSRVNSRRPRLPAKLRGIVIPQGWLIAFLAVALDAWAARILFLEPLASVRHTILALSFHSASILLLLPFWLVAVEKESGFSRPVLASLAFGFAAPLPLAGLLFLWSLKWVLSIRPEPGRRRSYALLPQFDQRQTASDADARGLSQSVVEILRSGESSLRRNAIIALRALSPRQAAPVLQHAVRDGDEQVRLLAQSQLQRILRRFEDLDLAAPKSPTAAPPTDRAAARRRLSLAEKHYEFVDLGLSSEDARSAHLARAADALEEALRLAPDDSAAELLLLKCRLKTERLAEAQQSLAALERAKFQRECLLPLKADYYYQARNWTKLKQTLADLERQPFHSSAANQWVQFWLTPRPTE